MNFFLKILPIVLLFQISFSQVNTESMRDFDQKNRLASKANFDFGYEKSNDEIFDILFTFRSDYYKPKNLHSFFILSYQNGFKSKLNEKNTIMNKGFGHFRITKQIFSNLGVETFSQIGFNDFISIKERKLFGSGIRTAIKEEMNFKSFFGAGFMKEFEEYDDIVSSTKILNRFTSYMTVNVNMGQDLSFSNITYYQPAISRIYDYRVLVFNEIKFKINHFSNINITINYRFDNEPHKNSGKSYFEINNGFEIIF